MCGRTKGNKNTRKHIFSPFTFFFLKMNRNQKDTKNKYFWNCYEWRDLLWEWSFVASFLLINYCKLWAESLQLKMILLLVSWVRPVPVIKLHQNHLPHNFLYTETCLNLDISDWNRWEAWNLAAVVDFLSRYHAQTATVNKENDSVTPLRREKITFRQKLIFCCCNLFIFVLRSIKCHSWDSYLYIR